MEQSIQEGNNFAIAMKNWQIVEVKRFEKVESLVFKLSVLYTKS